MCWYCIDTVTRLQIVLEADLPAEAYQALVALDLSGFQQGRCTTTAGTAGGAQSWMSGSSVRKDSNPA
jgi:hypothetical protein